MLHNMLHNIKHAIYMLNTTYCTCSHGALQMEAMEIWRVAADSGAFLLSMDDMYPVVCHAFVCPSWRSVAADMEGKQRCKFGESMYLRDSAEAWAAAASLLRCRIITLLMSPSRISCFEEMHEPSSCMLLTTATER